MQMLYFFELLCYSTVIGDDSVTVGERIKEARKLARLTQQELADKVGISYQQLSQYERGVRNPKNETIKRIADALEVGEHTLSPGRYGISDKIKNLRIYRGFTQEELSKKAGVPLQCVMDYELGVRMPDAETLEKLAVALDVSVYGLYPRLSPPDLIDAVSAVYTSNNFVNRILTATSKLNEEGQAVAAARVEELSEIPRYQAQPSTEPTTLTPEGKDTSEE